MTIEIGEIYTSYEVGSRAKVINIVDDIVEYEIVYHPDRPEIVGCRGKKEKHSFASRTKLFNVSYTDHKQKLKI